MMQTRIRYSKDIDGTMVSKEYFITTHHGPVRVRMNLQALKYSIVRCEDKEVVETGSARDIPQLKKATKDALKKHGVLFATETRNVEEKLESVGIQYSTDKRKV